MILIVQYYKLTCIYDVTDDSTHTYDGDILLMQDDLSSRGSDVEMENIIIVTKDAPDPGSETGIS